MWVLEWSGTADFSSTCGSGRFFEVGLVTRGGMTYNMALEPCSSYPPSLARAIEAGTQLRLEPGERIETELSAVVFKGIPTVSHITSDGEVKGTAPT